MEQAAEAVTGETGIRFELEVEEDSATITAIGEGAHASKPEEGNNALTGLLVLIQRLPFAACEQISTIGRLLELIPHGDTSGKALGIA